MQPNTNSYIKQITLGTLTVVLISVSVLGASWLLSSYFGASKRFKEIDLHVLHDQKQILKDEVYRAQQYIEFIKSRYEKEIKAQLASDNSQQAAMIENIVKRFSNLSESILAQRIANIMRDMATQSSSTHSMLLDSQHKVLFCSMHTYMTGQKMEDINDLDHKPLKELIAKPVADSLYLTCFELDKRNDKKACNLYVAIRRLKYKNWILLTQVYGNNILPDMQQEVIERLESIRCINGGYIFATTYDGLGLTAPAKGENMLGITDAEGRPIVKMLIDKAKAGGGFVEYVMPPINGHPEALKISYVEGVADWDWYIGCGIYKADIYLQTQRSRHVFLDIQSFNIVRTISIIILTMLFAWYLIKRLNKKLERDFADFADKLGTATTHQELIPVQDFNWSEFQNLANRTNSIIETLHKSQNNLKASVDRFEKFSQLTQEGIIISYQGLIIDTNKALAKLIDTTVDNLVGSPITSISTNPKEQQYLHDLLAGHSQEINQELSLTKGDNTKLVIELDSKLIVYGGQTVRVSAIRDITTAHASRRDLRVTSMALAAAISPVCLLNMDDSIRYLNQAFPKMWGHQSVNDLIGQDWVILWKDLATARQITDIVIENGQYVGEALAQFKDGTINLMEIQGSLVTDEDGTAICQFYSFSNIQQQKTSQLHLQESEQRYRSLTENSPDIMIRFNPRHEIVFINQAIANYYKEPITDILGHNFMELPLGRQAHKLWQKGLEQIFTMGKPFEGEFALNLLGNQYHFDVRFYPEFDNAGHPVYAIAVHRDITDRLLAAKQYQTLFNSMLNSFALHEIITDEQGKPIDYRFLLVNPMFEQMLGLNTDEIIGRTLRELFPNVEPYWIDRYGKVALTGESATFTDYFSTKGRFYNVLAYSPVERQFAVIFQDVTDTVVAQKTLKERNEFLVNIIESLTHPFYVVNVSNNQVEIANSAARGNKDITDIKCWELEADKKLDCQNSKEYCPLERVKQTGKAVSYTWQYKDISNHEHALQMEGYPVFDENNKLTQVIIQHYDITEVVNLQSQLQHSQRLEAVGRLAGGIAHDFNNVLTVINTYAYSMIDDTNTPDQQEGLDEIMKASQRAGQLTRRLLAFSRRDIITPEILNVKEFLVGVSNTLSKALTEQYPLIMALPETDCYIMADMGQLEQVLLNLTINARDALLENKQKQSGQVELEAISVNFDDEVPTVNEMMPPGSYIMLALSDNGCGMPAHVQEQVFEPFFTTKDKSHGTGLGLATVYGIVRQNKAYLNLYSEPGRGTTFKIYWPQVSGEGQNIKAPEPEITVAGAGQKILLVDDNEALRLSAVRVLRAAGYVVDSAPNGVEALELTQQNKFDMLITDVIMPVIDGRTLAQKVSAMQPDITVLYVSGYTDNHIVHHGILEKGINFLRKPYTPATFTSMVARVLAQKETKNA